MPEGPFGAPRPLVVVVFETFVSYDDPQHRGAMGRAGRLIEEEVFPNRDVKLSSDKFTIAFEVGHETVFTEDLQKMEEVAEKEIGTAPDASGVWVR